MSAPRGRLRKRTWAILVAVAVPGVAAILVLAQPRARASLRLVSGFETLEADPRIRFEPGAEEPARAIADALPDAVRRVETHQGGPFPRPFRVYVLASHESFARRTGQPASSPVRGIAFLRDVWISPKAFSFHGRDMHRESLAHELSHLHLGQKLGWWRRTRGVPSWFQEGLADWVADTGDEQVTPLEAREAILRGHRIELDTTGHLPLPKRPESYGMAWPMFHIQSRMFVEHLVSRDEAAFDRFVRAVVGGDAFAPAFEEAFEEALPQAWEDFASQRSPNPHM